MESKSPENKEVYILEKMEYLVPLNSRSKVMKVLRQNFNIKEIIVLDPIEEQQLYDDRN